MRKKFYAAALSVLLSVSMTGNAFAGWVNSSGQWYYENEDQSRLKNQWFQDGLHWYHLDQNGNMQTGWFTDVDGRKYYLDKNVGGPQGSMKTGWFQDVDGKWYWLNTMSDGYRGAMLTGWRWINGKCYYLQEDGSCLMGGVTPDGYTVDETGAWTVNGVVQIRSKATTSGGGGGGGGGSHSSGGDHETPQEQTVYAGDKTKTYGWSQEADTGVYYVTPGVYQDVYVTSSVENGEVILENVKVNGNLVVQGGGSGSVKLKSGTQIQGSVIMEKKTGGTAQIPRLELSDNVVVSHLLVKKPAMIEALSAAAGFREADVEADTTVKGAATRVESLNVNGRTNVNISQARVVTANVNGNAVLNGSQNAVVDMVKANSNVKVANLSVDQIQLGNNAALTLAGDSAVKQVAAADGTTVRSENSEDPVRITQLSASGKVGLTDVVVQTLTTGGAAEITGSGSATAIAGIEASHPITLDMNSTVGKVVITAENVAVTVGKNTTVNEVETQYSTSVLGEGSVGMVAAAQGTHIEGNLGAAVTEVEFLSAYPAAQRSVVYGGALPEDLPSEYAISGSEVGKISWNPYTFTSTQPGTYTVYGAWVSLPENVRAGSVLPTAVITVQEPDVAQVTFKETSGLTGLDLSVVSKDGTMFSYANGTADLLAGREYTYTVGKSGYKPVTGTVKADGNKTIQVTLEKALEKFHVAFEAPSDIDTYLNGAVPETRDYLEGTRIVLPSSHNRTGYRLVWTGPEAESGEVGELIVNQTGTYRAVWEAVTYSIAFEDGTVDGAKETYTVADQDYTLPTPSADQEKGRFDGWYTNASFAGSRVTKLAQGSTGDRVYFAKWLKSLPVTDNVAVTSDVSKGTLGNVYFAEGRSVVVDAYDKADLADNYELLVTVGGTQYLAKKDLNIFAGSYAWEADSACQGGAVTVQGGRVANIFGGGAGTSDSWTGHSAVTNGDVAITVNGGTVNVIYGGGSGLAKVDGTVTINVNGAASVNTVYGGGAAPHGDLKKLDVETHLSPNHVKRAEIYVAEGSVLSSLQGGAISIGSVGESQIRLYGTVKNRMIGAGTNGYTGSVAVTFGSTAVLEDGNAYPGSSKYQGNTIYQSGFRGLVGDVDIKAEAGAQIWGDIFLGTNALYDDGQNAEILGTVTAQFEDDPMTKNPDAGQDEPVGAIYLGAGEKGVSLNQAGDITVSGPVAVSPYLYSQRFEKKTADWVTGGLKAKVTLADGAYWDYGFSGGSGTEEDPFQISNAAELENINRISKDKDSEYAYYLLMDDIDLNELSTEAIKRACVVKNFKGVLDGGGHEILANRDYDCLFAENSFGAEFRNLTIIQDEHYLNLNAYVYGDIAFDGVDAENAPGTTFVTNSQNEGSYCSIILSEGANVTFENCHSSASYEVASGSWSGVFVAGYGQTDTKYVFKNCSNSGTVYGKYVALFIGNSTNASAVDNITIEDCSLDGYLYGTEFAGLFASINGSKGFEAANTKYADLVPGAADHIRTLSVEGITAKADAGGTITITSTSDATPVDDYTYVLNVFASYSTGDGGSSIITLDFPVENPEEALDHKAGWILDSVTAEEKYGIGLDELTWETVYINMLEQNYAYYEAEGEAYDGKTNAYYILDAEGLAGKGKIESKGTFQINAYLNDGETNPLAGTIKVDTSKVSYPTASQVKTLKEAVEPVKPVAGVAQPEQQPDSGAQNGAQDSENAGLPEENAGAEGGMGEIGTPEEGAEGGQGETGAPEEGAEGGQGEAGTPEEGAEGSQGEAGTPEEGAEGGQGEAGTPEEGAEGSQGETGTPEEGAEGGAEEPGTPETDAEGGQGETGTPEEGTVGGTEEPGTPETGTEGSQGESKEGVE